jgi:probable phosphoglycerate mutase
MKRPALVAASNTMTGVTIYLIRHGETEGNRLRIVQPPELPLNERGLRQARACAGRLRTAGIARIVASDLARAHMTAQALAGETGVPVELEPLLEERNFGDLRGHPYSSFDFDPMALDYSPPAGESWEDFHRRAGRAWRRVEELAEETEGALAIVTHGLVCHSFALHHLLLEPPIVNPERWGNTAVTEIERPAPWRVRVINCTRHLDCLPGMVDDVATPTRA